MTHSKSSSQSDKGSALILVPTLTLISILLLGIGVDSVAAAFAQRSLDTLGQSCALKAAQALSPSAFYNSGMLVISQQELQVDLHSCVISAELPSSLTITSSYATAKGGSVEVILKALVHPPIAPPLLRTISDIPLTTIQYAQEVPTAN